MSDLTPEQMAVAQAELDAAVEKFLALTTPDGWLTHWGLVAHLSTNVDGEEADCYHVAYRRDAVPDHIAYGLHSYAAARAIGRPWNSA